jgi:DNA-binding transcriptional ArsR family regulator
MHDTVKILKALSDPTRLEIVSYLYKDGGCGSCQEISECSPLSQPAKSHHFGKLVAAGVLIETKQGVAKTYTVNSAHLLDLGIDLKKLIFGNKK